VKIPMGVARAMALPGHLARTMVTTVHAGVGWHKMGMSSTGLCRVILSGAMLLMRDGERGEWRERTGGG
jgi:hypothetical protein